MRGAGLIRKETEGQLQIIATTDHGMNIIIA